MSDKIKELLAVLDMPDSQQRLWLFTHIGKDTSNDRDLADLAFRLRDEILSSENGTIRWVSGMFDVYMKMTGSKLLNWKWGYVDAQPIHWIVAALIAKGRTNEQD